LKAPNTLWAYLTYGLIKIGSLCANVSVDATFYRNVPKHIRGVMNGLYAFISGIGILAFSKISGIIYDKYGPEYPYLIIGLIDQSFAIFVILLALCRKFDQ
jgi:MFS family permease